MCPREDIDYQGSQLQELKADLESQVTAVKNELTDVKTELTKVKSDLDSKLVTVSRSLEEKLDAVLTKFGDKCIGTEIVLVILESMRRTGPKLGDVMLSRELYASSFSAMLMCILACFEATVQ